VRLCCAQQHHKRDRETTTRGGTGWFQKEGKEGKERSKKLLVRRGKPPMSREHRDSIDHRGESTSSIDGKKKRDRVPSVN